MKRCKFIICIILLLILNCYFFKVYADSNGNQLKVNNLNLGVTHYGGLYIYGEISSKTEPQIVFKSTDGEIQKEVYIEYRGNNRYYFDRHLVEIDYSKKYFFEVIDGDRKYPLDLNGTNTGRVFSGYDVSIFNNEVSFQEHVPVLNLNNLNFGITHYGGGYLYGELYSEVKPNIVFKSTDGEIQKEVYVQSKGNELYYFDRHLVEIDFNKSYVFEVTTQNYVRNIILGNDRELGKVSDRVFAIKDNEIVINQYQYFGVPSVELRSLNLGTTQKGNKYIYGNIEYYEIEDGIKKVAQANPKIVFKSTDGTEEKDVYVQKISDNMYYFDRHMVELDMAKQYFFEVVSGDEANTCTTKTDIILGKHHLGLNSNKYEIYTENNKVEFVFETYTGQPVVELNEFNINVAHYGNSYVYGKITYKENVNGKLQNSIDLPKIVFKSTDGTVQKEVYVQRLSDDTYYFDRHLAEIDVSKEYVFEVSSQDIRNTSKKVENINFKKVPKEYKNLQYMISISKDTNILIKSFTYEGDLYSNVLSFNINTTNNKGSYLYGMIDFKEFVDGIEKKQEFDPIMFFDSTDGTESHEVYMEKRGNSYYFDRHLVEIDPNKKYQFIIKTGDIRNISKNKNQVVDFSNVNKEYSTYEYKVKIDDNNQFNLKRDTYYGTLETYTYRISVNQNQRGHYINGNIDCYEWVNGTKRNLLFNPKIELVATDNSSSINCYVENRTSNGSGYEYYFDAYIDGINIWKEYVVKVTNLDKRNTNTQNNKKISVNNQTIGKYWEYEIKTNSNKIRFDRFYTEGTYGASGFKVQGDYRGTDLKYYKIGNGPNVFFATFAIHGWEDDFNFDGQELTKIAENFKNRLIQMEDFNFTDKWTIYIFPSLNPDGEYYGWSHNEEGRTTYYSAAPAQGKTPAHKGIDMNRTWSTGWTKYVYNNKNGYRNYNGTEPFQAYEARSLRDFLLSHKAYNGQTILVDLHGWLNETIGDNDIGWFYRNQMNLAKHIDTYGMGYLVNWARANLGANGRSARSCLVELPAVYSSQQVSDWGLSDKYIEATLQMLRSII